MKKSRKDRVIEYLSNSVNKTASLKEINDGLLTDWAPRAISEARKAYGYDVISGDNPYTLNFLPDNLKKKSYEFDPERQVYIYG